METKPATFLLIEKPRSEMYDLDVNRHIEAFITFPEAVISSLFDAVVLNAEETNAGFSSGQSIWSMHSRSVNPDK